jgi:hypothetical protein
MVYTQLSWLLDQMLTLYSSFDDINVHIGHLRLGYEFWHVFMLNMPLYQELHGYLRSVSSVCSLSSYSMYFAAHSAGK